MIWVYIRSLNLNLLRSDLVTNLFISIVFLSLIFIAYSLMTTIVSIFYEIYTGSIFGRIWQSVYMRSIIANYYRIIKQKSMKRLGGFLAKQYTSIHQLLVYNIVMVIMIMSVFLLIITIFLATYLYSNLPSGVNMNRIWNFILTTIGVLLPTLFFFSSYVRNRMNVNSTLGYFPYLILSTISFGISILFLSVITIYGLGNSNQNATIALSVSLMILSSIFLLYVVGRVLYISFTGNIRKIQRKAANRYIIREASRESQIYIANEIIKCQHYPNQSQEKQSPHICGRDIGLEENEYITDINISKIRYLLKKHDHSISNFGLQVEIGDQITPEENIVTIETESSSDSEGIEKEFTKIFKTKKYDLWNTRFMDDIYDDHAFTDYLAEVEQECKTAIKRGNIARLRYHLKKYQDLSIVIGEQRMAYSEEEVRLRSVSRSLADSIGSIYYQFSSVEQNTQYSDRDAKISASIADTIYNSYKYSKEDQIIDTPVFSDLLNEVIESRETSKIDEYTITSVYK